MKEGNQTNLICWTGRFFAVIKNIKVNIKSDHRVLGATMAGSKQELGSYLIGPRISTAASDQLLHVTGHVGIHSVEDPDDDESEFLTVKQEIVGHWKRYFLGKKWVQTKLSEAEIVHFFSTWDPDGNISSSELEQPEPDVPGDDAMSYLNDDCDDDIQLSKSRKGGEILELNKVS